MGPWLHASRGHRAIIAVFVCACVAYSISSVFAASPQCPNATDSNNNSACIVPNGTTIQQFTVGNYPGITEVDSGGKAQVGTANGQTGQLNGGDTATNNGTVQLEGPTSFPTLINNSSWQISTGGSTAVSGTLTNAGTFQIANGGSASASTLTINDGNFQLANGGTSLTVTNNIGIGETNSGAPTLQIASGATAISLNGIVGDVAGSNGTANIDGTNSSWTLENHLSVGNLGTGTLTITNGATVSDALQGFNNATTCIGCGTNSTGTVTVAGSTTTTPGTATLSIQGHNGASPVNIFVGESGTGTLTVANGGIVTAGSSGTGTIEVAVNAGSTGTLALSQSAGQNVPTVNASTIQFGSGSGKLIFGLDPSAPYTFSPTITGPGLVVVNTGVIVFNAETETYTGATSISSGATLRLTGGTSISASQGVAANGTFDISGNGSTAIKSLTGTGGQVNLGANTLTVTASGSFSGTLGAVGDSGGFTVSDSGSPPTQQTLTTVTGNYTGATTINSGDLLVLSTGTNISASSGVIDSGVFDISSNGNTSIKTLTGGGVAKLGANTLTVTQAAGTFSGTLGVTNDTGGFTVASGTQTLDGVTAPYSGTTTINTGANLILTGATKIGAVALCVGI